MLGIIIKCAREQVVDPAIYQKIGPLHVLEYIIDNALKTEHAQKVIVCAPASERRNIKGGGIYLPVVQNERSYFDRRANFYFAGEMDDLDAVFKTALHYGLDHIVLVNGNCPLLPPWLLNDMIWKYRSEYDSKVIVSNFNAEDNTSYNIGFQTVIFPFWMLAQTQLQAEDDERKDFIKYMWSNFPQKFYANLEENEFIEPSSLNLTFQGDNLEEFDFLLSEVNKGAELSEVIKDLYDQSQNAQEQ